MSNFTLYLHLDGDNNFIWHLDGDDNFILNEKQDLAQKFDRKPPSRLDFKVATGESFDLGIGDSLKTWRFGVGDLGRGRVGALRLNEGYRHPEDGRRQSGECSFKQVLSTDKKILKVINFQSDKPQGSTNKPSDIFTYDLFLENFTSDGRITKIIIDPIITNDGTNGP